MTVLLLLNALVFCCAAQRSLLSRGDVTVPEGAVVYSIKGLLTGAWPLYRDYTLPPYGTTPYTPLFYLVSALAAWGTTHSVSAIYTCCRLLTLLSTFGAAVCSQKLFLLVKPDARAFSVLAFCMPFTILTLVAWGFAARPDMLATWLSLTGMYVYLRRQDSPFAACGSAVVLALAWGCKQSFVAAPAAVLLTLLSLRQWRRAGMFLLAYCAAVATIAVVAQGYSHGWFYRNIVTANITRLKPALAFWYITRGFFFLAPFISMAALPACAVDCRAIARDRASRALGLYLLASFGLNALACLKDGAYFNYMIEPLFVASLFASIAVTRMARYAYGAAAMPLALLASLAFSYHFYGETDGATGHALRGDIPHENANIRCVLDAMDALPGDVLTSSSGLAVRSAKPALVIDVFNARYLEEEGKLSTRMLADRIRRHAVSAIVAQACREPAANCNLWPQQVQDAILGSYAPREGPCSQVWWYPKAGSR